MKTTIEINGKNVEIELTENTFVIHICGSDEYTQIDKRLFDKFINMLTEDMSKCTGCKYYLSQDGNYPIDPCCECSRFYGDKYE